MFIIFAKKRIMQVHKGYEDLDLKNPVVTLGVFDGVHRGHRTVIDRLLLRARQLGGESIVISFFPHPRQVLKRKADNFGLLTSLEETGIDHLVIIEFNRDFSNKTACSFVEDILLKKIGTRNLIVGFNNHFGKRGEGNFETIRSCAEDHDFYLEQVEALNSEFGIISSSAIRKALMSGELEKANHQLGYDYFLHGSVIRGRKLGRELGYPTANIMLADKNKLLPKDGVYAVELLIEDEKYKGVLSIGLNPTVNSGPAPRSIEVHIFGFNRDIYGKELCIIFRFRLRDELYFDTLEGLKVQIEEDRIEAIKLLG